MRIRLGATESGDGFPLVLMSRNTVTRSLILLSALLCTWLAASASFATTRASLPHWQDKRYIEDSFLDIAMSSEYERLSPVVRKWNRPLRIWIKSTAGDAEEQRWMLAMHFVQLGRITGLPVYFVDKLEHANVRIFFVGEKDVHEVVAREMTPVAKQQIDDTVCIGSIGFNRWAEITRGTVVIPVERAEAQGKLVSCVVEEVTQMLGLINDSSRIYPTVFSDVTDDQFLTGLDFVLLKLLYSPQVRNGMTAKEVLPLIRHQLVAWERSGLIMSASALIADSPLLTLAARSD